MKRSRRVRIAVSSICLLSAVAHAQISPPTRGGDELSSSAVAPIGLPSGGGVPATISGPRLAPQFVRDEAGQPRCMKAAAVPIVWANQQYAGPDGAMSPGLAGEPNALSVVSPTEYFFASPFQVNTIDRISSGVLFNVGNFDSLVDFPRFDITTGAPTTMVTTPMGLRLDSGVRLTYIGLACVRNYSPNDIAQLQAYADQNAKAACEYWQGPGCIILGNVVNQPQTIILP